MKKTTIGQRVRKLLQDDWQGRQRRMAADLGVSRSVISRSVNEQRSPSFQLISAIAEKLPEVDLRWLVTGVGHPFGDETQNVTDDPRLPVAATALLNVPADHPGRSIPVAKPLFTQTRYVCELRPNDPAVHAANEHFLPGDGIILEKDPAFWREDFQRIRDRLCAVRLHVEEGVHGLLGRVRCRFGSPETPIAWFVDVFGVGEVPLVFGGAESVKQKADGNIRDPGIGKPYRPIDLGDDQLPATQRLATEVNPDSESTESTGAGESRTAKDEVVAELFAVAIYLYRELGDTETTQR